MNPATILQIILIALQDLPLLASAVQAIIADIQANGANQGHVDQAAALLKSGLPPAPADGT